LAPSAPYRRSPMTTLASRCVHPPKTTYFPYIAVIINACSQLLEPNYSTKLLMLWVWTSPLCAIVRPMCFLKAPGQAVSLDGDSAGLSPASCFGFLYVNIRAVQFKGGYCKSIPYIYPFIRPLNDYFFSLFSLPDAIVNQGNKTISVTEVCQFMSITTILISLCPTFPLDYHKPQYFSVFHKDGGKQIERDKRKPS
jgi:hypothetical protein